MPSFFAIMPSDKIGDMNGELINGGATMKASFVDCGRETAIDAETRRESALAIKACLDSLKTDARAFALRDLECFLELAALAAEEAAAKLDGSEEDDEDPLLHARTLGQC